MREEYYNLPIDFPLLAGCRAAAKTPERQAPEKYSVIQKIRKSFIKPICGLLHISYSDFDGVCVFFGVSGLGVVVLAGACVGLAVAFAVGLAVALDVAVAFAVALEVAFALAVVLAFAVAFALVVAFAVGATVRTAEVT